MTHFDAYLLTRLDSLNSFFALMVVGGLFGAFFAFLFDSDESDKVIKVLLIIFFFGIVGKTLTPSSKEAAFIYIAPAIVNNEDLQKTVKQLPELSNLGMEYLNGLLKKEIKEGK